MQHLWQEMQDTVVSMGYCDESLCMPVHGPIPFVVVVVPWDVADQAVA
jgi:hypothetical protein